MDFQPHISPAEVARQRQLKQISQKLEQLLDTMEKTKRLSARLKVALRAERLKSYTNQASICIAKKT